MSEMNSVCGVMGLNRFSNKGVDDFMKSNNYSLFSSSASLNSVPVLVYTLQLQPDLMGNSAIKQTLKTLAA